MLSNKKSQKEVPYIEANLLTLFMYNSKKSQNDAKFCKGLFYREEVTVSREKEVGMLISKVNVL
jgi:hypothetical protein